MKVFITRKVPSIAERLLKKNGFDVSTSKFNRTLTRKELVNKCRNADAVLSVLNDNFDSSLINELKSCKIIANYAVGYNNIDVKYAKSKKIIITNTPDVLTDATAEIALSLMLSCSRRIVEADTLIRDGKFKGWEPEFHLGLELRGKTLGIVGAGRIGQATAVRAKAFGMKVIYFNRTKKKNFEIKTGAQKVQLKTLLKRSDIISLHLPISDKTRYILNKENLELLKSNAILINTARGELVDENHLISMLRKKRIYSAGLDVFENEPDINNGFMKLKNVVMLPHIGSATKETRDKMAELAAQNIINVLNGKRALTPI